MLEDLLDVVFVTETLLTIFLEQLRDQIDKLIAVLNLIMSSVWENDFTVLDLVHEYLTLSIEEGRHSNEHLIHQNAKGPPIDISVMTRIVNHLRCKILGSAAITLRQLIILQHFRQPIINDLQITLIINKDIFQFKISMHNTLLVQLTNCKGNLGSIEPYGLLIESLLRLENFV